MDDQPAEQNLGDIVSRYLLQATQNQEGGVFLSSAALAQMLHMVREIQRDVGEMRAMVTELARKHGLH